MNDQVKFADMRVGDTVEFESLPAVGAPLGGVVALLNTTMLTYENGGAKTSLRRAALRLERRTRNRETGHSHWVFQ